MQGMQSCSSRLLEFDLLEGLETFANNLGLALETFCQGLGLVLVLKLGLGLELSRPKNLKTNFS